MDSGCDRCATEFDGIVGSSPALRAVLDQVRIVAPTGATVLIEGETGTGKELIARAIHMHSERRQRPFVKVNCAAIPAELLESELFGHERGAFTGAVAQRIGRFEAANGGTLFLDEIGEMPLHLQAKLLRCVQEQEFERVGGNRTIHVDVRIVAATNRDLKAMVEENKFRADLYYRLAVFPLNVPPLRERREDIPVLTRYFVQKHAQRMGRNIESIPTHAMEALTNYDWPGNIRELQNVIERSVVLSNGPELHVALPEITGRSAADRVARPGFECDRAIRARAHTAGVKGNQGNGRGTERGSRPARAEADDPAITHAEIQHRAAVSVSNGITSIDLISRRRSDTSGICKGDAARAETGRRASSKLLLNQGKTAGHASALSQASTETGENLLTSFSASLFDVRSGLIQPVPAWPAREHCGTAAAAPNAAGAPAYAPDICRLLMRHSTVRRCGLAYAFTRTCSPSRTGSKTNR